MKFSTLSFIVAGALSFSIGSQAQTKHIEIDGQDYICRPDKSGGGNGNSASCANKAYSGPFTKRESLQLCQGSRGTGAADCALAAYSGPFTKRESLTLCTGSRTAGPGECAIKAYSGPFTKRESLTLCTGARTSGPGDCAILAYSGPFTKRESLALCEGARSKRPARCALEAYSGPFSKRESLEMCKRQNRRQNLSSAWTTKVLNQKVESNKSEILETIKAANEKAFMLNEYKTH